MKANLYSLACVMALLSVSFNDYFSVGMKW